MDADRRITISVQQTEDEGDVGAGDRNRRGWKAVYMDHNATTPMHPEVIRVMTEAMSRYWRNPSSDYAPEVREAISSARKQVADMVSCSPEEIIFVSSGTEANNWILESVLAATTANSPSDKSHVITSDIEHVAVGLKLEELERRGCCEVDRVSAADHGRVRASDVIKRVRPGTRLISIMLANNETGCIQPVDEIARQLRPINSKRKECNLPVVLVHTDSAQAVGKMPVSTEELGVDFLTIVGHKFYGPRSAAVFCNRENLKLLKERRMFQGGGQERSLRPGTENTVDIIGLGMAAETVRCFLRSWCENIRVTGAYFVTRLNETFGESAVLSFVGMQNDILPNTFSISFRDHRLKGPTVLKNCNVIQASTGAACHTGLCSASSALMNSGLTEEAALNTIRLSVGKDTTTKDIDVAIADLTQAVQKITSETVQ
ncbi:hypothetical protein RvY_09167 [Ramazzottius varieornatus]|uniref:Selenocysteine lyase n=1 Tax=Ramazzottius varieornatus TaxID=947166 RepID=A0A1D1VD01_RAMVA|nr:hypothetical protein RvY_09167 [Ramazzottius varieornatus]